jgi:hypothetical protein
MEHEALYKINNSFINKSLWNLSYLRSHFSTYGCHVVTFLVHFIVFPADVELPEEVEGDYGVDVDDDGEQHDCQHQLLSVVRYRLENGLQGWNRHSNIQQMCSKEEVVDVAQDGEAKIPQTVQESLKRELQLLLTILRLFRTFSKASFLTLSVTVTPAFQI